MFVSWHELWRARPLASMQVFQLPLSTAMYVGQVVWCKNAREAKSLNGGRMSCHWGSTYNDFTNMRLAASHFPRKHHNGTQLFHRSIFNKPVQSRLLYSFPKAGYTCNRTRIINHSEFSLYYWWHEINGYGILCECGRRFAGPEDAAFHIFHVMESPSCTEHRCNGTGETPWTIFDGAMLTCDRTIIPDDTQILANKAWVHGSYYFLD